MSIQYELIPVEKVSCIRDLVNELMAYQKSLAHIRPDRFDTMNFESRMLPSVQNARENFILVAKDAGEIVAYVYSNISPKEIYSNEFAAFFDMNSVEKDDVGCLSQFYIKEGYRSMGIGSELFNRSMEWLNTFDDIEDIFIYVSNGNEAALQFYQGKGFKVSHQILDGFITVLRNK